MRKHIKVIGLLLSCILFSCEKAVQTDIPQGMYDAEVIFNDKQTAESALIGIYTMMSTQMSSLNILTTKVYKGVVGGLLGLSADELIRATFTEDQQGFADNLIGPSSALNVALYSTFYNYAYQANRLITGLKASDKMSEQEKLPLMAEALVIRALSHFYLTNLYKNPPMVIGSNYIANMKLAHTEQAEHYRQIETDLLLALEQLPQESPQVGKRYRISYWAVKALLARVYLYQGKWSSAEKQASDLLANASYALESINRVFLADSKEAIWNLDNTQTNLYSDEANYFSGSYLSTLNTEFRLTEFVIDQFDPSDLRLKQWTKEGTGIALGTRSPWKLHMTTNLQPNAVKEASTPLRLAEQYLIRAEAYAHQGKLREAIADIDKIRIRAGAGADPNSSFKTLSAFLPNPTQEEVITAIYNERLRELFAEYGHRWLDAKRSGQSLSTFFGSRKPQVKETAAYFPYPISELQFNTNLKQNEGY